RTDMDHPFVRRSQITSPRPLRGTFKPLKRTVQFQKTGKSMANEELTTLIEEIRAQVDGFNPPATETDLARLHDMVGHLPDDLLLIYRDHDGSVYLPSRDPVRRTARLMPIAEVLRTKQEMAPFAKDLPAEGCVTCFWTDDNSNYCGIYTDGPLSGWLTCLNHDEPMLTPAFRSVVAFLKRLLASAPGIEPKSAACDLPTV